ncbi:MAG TPA: DUF1576 domain-containing protein [Bacillota bacterium]|nr:DUF1576 domain-containing protein [Bacillota bacterium]HOH09787.1 DUF1576 domain-containing protein [Bacillota bacterium]HOS50800.1 DUF1576 domain-containing protein [Bacillota bacterium]HOY88554.1 DUF1576 domain-containing protein [Bacillota bacterium]HPI00674.1 DUF1576 domain-containing protein [Bacillota bacterium]
MDVATPSRARAASTALYLSAAFSLSMVVFGFIASSSPLASLMAIWRSPGLLVTDFSLVGDIGSAFINAGLMGLLAAVLAIAGGEHRGIAASAVFMCIGFAFFGKTPISGAVIIAGCCLRSLIARRKPLADIVIGLFGTGLSPLVSFVATSTPAGWLGAIAAGLAAGYVLQDVSAMTKRLYKGMNLYNVGFASAFIAVAAANVIRGLGITLESPSSQLAAYPDWSFLALIAFYSAVALLSLILVRGSWKGFVDICVRGGTNQDLLETGGLGGALLNFAASGLICILVYRFVLGVDLTGPLLGTIIAVNGWAFFGMRPFAMISVMSGYALASLITSYPMSNSLAIAAMFSTALCPISDGLGHGYGLLAGFFHLFIVCRSAAIHGGLLLYNNGFSTGMVAVVVLAIAKSFGSRKAMDI